VQTPCMPSAALLSENDAIMHGASAPSNHALNTDCCRYSRLLVTCAQQGTRTTPAIEHILRRQRVATAGQHLRNFQAASSQCVCM
jgi:hypothetical protein